jgi:hypothetical protein
MDDLGIVSHFFEDEPDCHWRNPCVITYNDMYKEVMSSYCH